MGFGAHNRLGYGDFGGYSGGGAFGGYAHQPRQQRAMIADDGDFRRNRTDVVPT
jgi:hypothetical protein